MTEFSFTASAECDRCGKWLASSNESCNLCHEFDERRYHFVRVGDIDDVELVWAINPIRAWAELQDCVENVLPYRLYETGYMSIDYKQFGYDVADEDDLRAPITRKT